ncbi:MAG: hypothetical protein RIR62_1534, partial [Pseudomonadota bacterium]
MRRVLAGDLMAGAAALAAAGGTVKAADRLVAEAHA